MSLSMPLLIFPTFFGSISFFGVLQKCFIMFSAHIHQHHRVVGACVCARFFLSIFRNLKLWSHTNAQTRFYKTPSAHTHTINFTYARGVNLLHFTNAMSNAEEFSWISLFHFSCVAPFAPYSIKIFLDAFFMSFSLAPSPPPFAVFIFIVKEFLCFLFISAA